MVKILIVDDDKNTRLYFKAFLQQNKYTVFTAKDGQEALDMLDKEHIDLAIVDIMMPNINGYEFTQMLRDANFEMPILMVSAKQLAEDRKKGYFVGIDDFMVKPVDQEEMLLKIKALLRRSKIVSDRKIVIGDVEINYDNLSVTRNGEVQELPQKEFMLLYKLLSYPNKIFTRIQLMDEIWGMDCETGWETVTVHIGRLRKRFEHFTEFEIVSVRGLGYKAVKKV